MATLNKVMLMGRLTDNPEPPRTLPNSGSMVVKFSFAVGRSKKNPQTGQWDPDPNPLFIDCEAFTRQDAKRDLVSLISQYCKKGDPLYIEGRLQLDRWEDKNGGGKRSKHKLVVENIEFLGGNRGDEGGGGMGGEGRVSRPMSGGMNRGNAPRGNYPPAQQDVGDDEGGSGGGGGGTDGNGEDIPF
jgi:single-strand DNA-binding protein